MKKLKKLLSIVLAVAMVMSLAVSVTADDYTITINNSSEGYTYTAYQIFSGTLEGSVLSDIVWGSNIDDTSTAGGSQTIYEALAEITDSTGKYPFAENTTDGTGTLTSAKAVAEALSDYSDDSDVVKAFAEIVAKYVSGSAAGSTSTLESGVYKIEDLPAGYYLITETIPTTGTNTAVSDYILKVVKNTEVNPKKSVPSLDKTVADVNDSDSTATQGDTDSADYDIGDTVPFTLTATVGSTYADYTEYVLVFNDTMSDGLTFDSDSVKVTIDGTDITTSNYTVATATTYVVDSTVDENTDFSTGHYYTSDQGGTAATGYTANTTYYVPYTTVTITLTDLKAIDISGLTIAASSTVVVTYNATLNKYASYSENNEASLTYSNNPNDTTSTGITPVDLTTVFTYTLTVTKVDGDNSDSPLSGATFTLYKKVSYDASSGDTYYSVGTDGKLAIESNASTGNYYYVVVGELNDTEATGTGSNVYTFSGIDDGEYVLVETKAPDGYNTIDDIYFTVEATHTENGGVSALTIKNSSGAEISGAGGSFSTTPSTGNIATTIKNSTGETLPETGGIGVTIFYVVGGILILAAVGVIVINLKKIKK